MKKIWILLAMTTLSLTLFTACTSSADTMPSPTVSNTPGATTTAMPENTMNPSVGMAPSATAESGVTGMTNGTSATGTTDTMNNGGVNSVDDSLRVSGLVADEVEKLSEIDDAEAVVAGNIALVAVSYDSQYQGGMTERLREMITDRVETVDKAVTSVHVTDKQEMVDMIAKLHESLKSAGVTFEELQTQVLDIGSQITGGGTPQVSQPQSNTQG